MIKRRVPKKIKILLKINAVLLVCICICSILLVKRISQLNAANGTSNLTTSLDDNSSSIEWVKTKEDPKVPILMYHSVPPMPI